MSKHILDREHVASASARSAQYFRIESTQRPQLQSKVLQRRPQKMASTTRVKRFTDIDRNKTS